MHSRISKLLTVHRICSPGLQNGRGYEGFAFPDFTIVERILDLHRTKEREREREEERGRERGETQFP